MKIVTIYRGNLELERVHLGKPVTTIGRSPINDVVLRAPGVAPLHFLIEWVGAGAFDPSIDLWSISDISGALNSSTDAAGEGVVLEGVQVSLSGFRFAIRNDALEATPSIGGAIREGLTLEFDRGGIGALNKSLLEMVQIRNDSGSIEEIRHVLPLKKQAPKSVLRATPQLRTSWDQGQLQLLLSEMPGAALFNRGQRVPSQDSYKLQGNDVIQVRWKAYDFYFRYVPRIQIPAVKREVVSDPLLKKLILIALTLFALIMILLLIPHKMPVEPPPPPPPRVATVEIKTVANIPPPPEPTADPTPVEQPKVKVGMKAQPKNENAGAAATARFVGDKKPAPGLNNSAKTGATNQVGMLGLFKGASSKKGPGVRADMLLNQGIVTNTVSGNSTDSGVVVKNPPAGIVGKGTRGSSKSGSDGDGLVAAETTFAGGDKYNPGSQGPLSRAGAKGEGFNPGSSLGTGKGLSGGETNADSEMGSLNAGSFDVKGGLDRETVRRVIAGYRGQIRTCYERALLSSPSLNGRIVFKWSISAAGPVTSASVTSSTVESKILETCVNEVIKGMQYPAAANGLPTVVKYPFVFQSKK